MDMNEMKQKHIWAVIGVTQDKSKFGYKIYKKLLEHNKKVYAINPNYSEIDGNKCYKNLKALPELPEVLDFVVAPKYSKEYIKEAMELGIQNYWFQPGTHNKEVLEMAGENGCNVVTECVLVEF